MITMQYKDLEDYNHNHQFACDARIQQYESFYNYILQNIEFIINFNEKYNVCTYNNITFIKIRFN